MFRVAFPNRETWAANCIVEMMNESMRILNPPCAGRKTQPVERVSHAFGADVREDAYSARRPREDAYSARRPRRGPERLARLHRREAAASDGRVCIGRLQSPAPATGRYYPPACTGYELRRRDGGGDIDLYDDELLGGLQIRDEEDVQPGCDARMDFQRNINSAGSLRMGTSQRQTSLRPPRPRRFRYFHPRVRGAMVSGRNRCARSGPRANDCVQVRHYVGRM